MESVGLFHFDDADARFNAIPQALDNLSKRGGTACSRGVAGRTTKDH
jgi:hypothetical protein